MLPMLFSPPRCFTILIVAAAAPFRCASDDAAPLIFLPDYAMLPRHAISPALVTLRWRDISSRRHRATPCRRRHGNAMVTPDAAAYAGRATLR